MDDLAASSGRGGLSSDVYALLAQANLLRMRGCWGEAIENCMAALRLTPDSHSAQSLLGDIYESQGRHDDAIQWYRMALDLNPQSAADRLKLERLLALQHEDASGFLSASRTEGEVRPGAQAVDEPHNLSDPGIGPQSRLRIPLKPDMALRITALTAALLVFAVITFAYVSVHRRGALSALGLSQNLDVKTPLIVVPSVDIPSPPRATMGTLRDASDQALLDSLQSSQELASSGVAAYDVQTDPRTARLTLTYGVVPGPAGGLSREAILRSALHLVQATSVLPGGQSAPSFTVRCLTSSSNGSGPPLASLAFVGDIPREVIPTTVLSQPSLTGSQIQALFGGGWWSAQIPG